MSIGITKNEKIADARSIANNIRARKENRLNAVKEFSPSNPINTRQNTNMYEEISNIRYVAPQPDNNVIPLEKDNPSGYASVDYNQNNRSVNRESNYNPQNNYEYNESRAYDQYRESQAYSNPPVYEQPVANMQSFERVPQQYHPQMPSAPEVTNKICDVGGMTIGLLNVTPKHVEVRDESGELSERISAIEKRERISVIPVGICGIPNYVTSLKHHKLIDLKGIRCAMSTDKIINADLFESTCKAIENTLKVGREYKENLQHTYILNGDSVSNKSISFTTLKFNEYELNYIITLYQHYNAKVYEINGTLELSVGSPSGF